MKVIIHTIDGKEHHTDDDGTIKDLVQSGNFHSSSGIIISSEDGKHSKTIFTKFITAIEFKEEQA